MGDWMNLVPVFECGWETNSTAIDTRKEMNNTKEKVLDVLWMNQWRVCEILKKLNEENKEKSLTEQIKIIMRFCRTNWLLEKKHEETEEHKNGKCLCCMDDRVPKWKNTLNIAGSGILFIGERIQEWYDWDVMIEMLWDILALNKVTTISSHQDCWAAKLFCQKMKDHFWVSNIEEVENKLENIFPWFSLMSVNEDDLHERKEDEIVAKILKYVSLKLWMNHTHLNLVDEKGELSQHISRTVIIDLTSYNLTWFFEKTWVAPWYFLDASIFLNHPEHFTRMVEEAIISKIIALKKPIICEQNNMFTIITYQNGQEEITQYLQREIDRIICEDHHYLVWKYKIFAVKI